MKVIQHASKAQSILRTWRLRGESIGYVPTMGALHAGHSALFATAEKNHNHWICSLFVNPLQFDRTSDLNTYPRTMEADLVLLRSFGCDLVYAPLAEEFYSKKPVLNLDFGSLVRTMEGRHRSGHFSGVGIVLARMFHIIQPQVVYLGQKDWQQYLVVCQLIEDLGFAIEARVIATVRESNGLAYSSRNQRLSAKGRNQAALLYKGLCRAQKAILSGQNPSQAQQETLAYWNNQTELLPEYLAIVDSYTLQPIDTPDKHPYVSLCAAAEIEQVRLIDNVFLDSSPLSNGGRA